MGFAERLLYLREQSRLSQDELGDAIDSSGPTIHRWEKGKGGPSLKQAVEMARVLGVDLEVLAYEHPPRHIEPLAEDEAAVLNLYRALRLDSAEALRRLATPVPDRQVAEPAHAPSDQSHLPPEMQGGRAAYDPANPWLGPQADLRGRHLREEAERKRPAPMQPKRPSSGHERSSSGPAKRTEGKKGTEKR
jgi:transcriptional regulator with XRE-family HTH domain